MKRTEIESSQLEMCIFDMKCKTFLYPLQWIISRVTRVDLNMSFFSVMLYWSYLALQEIRIRLVHVNIRTSTPDILSVK